MKILGVIAEYNPFHLGHEYHLNTAKKMVKPDGVICILSSNFLQRGEPALVDKWTRCEMALKAGIDLVLELPTAFSSRSAMWFALGGVKSLAETGIITHLAFGAETDNLDLLQKIADILVKENKTFKSLLNQYLNKGYSYPKSRSLALKEILKNKEKNFTDELNNPNNILALAYLRTLKTINKDIKPVLIKRIGNYHEIKPEKGLASATAIRNFIFENNSLWEEYVPLSTKKILINNFNQGKGPVFINNLEQSIIAAIRRMKPEDIGGIIEVTEGLENRIWNLANQYGDFNSLLKNLKTKRYTHTRIQRLLIHTFINYTKDISVSDPYYLRVLGFNNTGKKLLKLINKKATLPIITKFSKGYDEINGKGKKLLDLEIRATDLYFLFHNKPEMRKGRLEFYQSPVII